MKRDKDDGLYVMYHGDVYRVVKYAKCDKRHCSLFTKGKCDHYGLVRDCPCFPLIDIIDKATPMTQGVTFQRVRLFDRPHCDKCVHLARFSETGAKGRRVWWMECPHNKNMKKWDGSLASHCCNYTRGC